MSNSLLAQIRGAEEEAEEIRRQAQAQARDILKGTEEALRRDGRQAASEQRARIAQAQRAAEAESEIETENFVAQRRAERAQRMEAAKKNLGIASAFVYGRIVNHGKA
jgi:V/A-type H+-transporting ATPase subunit G/H